MDVIEAIKSRHSIRKYKKEKLSRDLILEVLESARWAPSAHNFQPWKVYIVDEDDKIKALSEIVQNKSSELLAGFNIVMKDTAEKLKESPCLLVIYSDNCIEKKFGKFGEFYKRISSIYETQSIATFMQNIMVCANSLNLGMAWYGMPLFCEEELNKFFEIPGSLSAILTIGHPDEKPKVTKRKELEKIVSFL